MDLCSKHSAPLRELVADAPAVRRTKKLRKVRTPEEIEALRRG